MDFPLKLANLKNISWGIIDNKSLFVSLKIFVVWNVGNPLTSLHIISELVVVLAMPITL